MESSRIKVKIGDHEFEAEGPTELVKEQFAAFKDIISSLPTKSGAFSSLKPDSNQENSYIPASHAHVELEKILHVSGRVVSLTALPTSTEDAALLIMLGHKDMRNNVSVTGQDIGDGLAQSGKPVDRVDRLLDKAISEAYILKTGIKRSTRYRLTNQGLNKAVSIARDLIANLP